MRATMLTRSVPGRFRSTGGTALKILGRKGVSDDCDFVLREAGGDEAIGGGY